MLVSDIITRVRTTAGDKDALQFTDQDVMRWINDAMQEVAADNQLLQKIATTATVAGTDNYAIPTDILKLHSVRLDGRKIRVTTLNDAEQDYGFEEPERGDPSLCYVWAGFIKFLPIPDRVQDLEVVYTRNPTDVTAVGNTPELPPMYHQRLMDYCLAQVAQMDDDMDRYNIKMNEFRTGVQNLKDHPEWEHDAYPYITVSERDMGDA